MRVRIGTGGLLALIVLAVIILIAGLRWLGSNAAAIKAGVGTGVLVLVVAGVLGLAVHWLLRAYQAEALPWQQRPAPPAMPPAVMTAEVLPAAPAELTAPAAPAAIAAPPPGVTVVVSTAEAAAAFAANLHVPPQGGQGGGSPAE
jgi:hypothetical protein